MKDYQELAFTMIELLIVIAIIGVLSAISVVAMRGAREASRDAKRKADLESIRASIEIYRADCKTYPNPWTPTAGSSLTASCTGSTNTYIESVPGDPDGSTSYFYSSDGTTYRLCAALEDPGSVMTCSGCTIPGCNYRVGSP